MSAPDWADRLTQVTAIAGVRGAVVITAEDGLVVFEAAVEGLEPADVAALAAAVVRRADEFSRVLGNTQLGLCTLAAEHGTLLAAQGRDGMWLVAIADPGAELGRLRLLLGDLAPEFA
jgi:predicted regulator of Ras-like GTPase activity (Roadblock/LC7/MglB family)